jgi:hypothetical protein
VDQIVFMNGKILEVIDTILAQSDTPPIIIIQSDHGWDRGQFSPLRLLNLNAYLVPDAVKTQLYPTITPVNSFRLIFDTVFGTQLGLLPDESFHSSGYEPFKLYPLQGDDLAQCQDSTGP